jgi:hypothetical protein
MQTRILDEQPRLLLKLAPDTLLRCFPGLELPAQTVPLAFVNIIWFLVAIFQT